MKKIDFARVLSWLGFVLRCPICSHKYMLEHTHIVDTAQDDEVGDTRILVHSDCQKCKSSVMFNIDIHGTDIFSVGMVTDLTSQDSTKFSKMDPLTSDDCIIVHKSLKSFNGDFVKAFKHPVKNNIKKTA